MMEYFGNLVSAQRKNPQDDLISAMIADSAPGGGIESNELVANCVFLLWAGHETTKNLISGSVLALLRNPGQ